MTDDSGFDFEALAQQAVDNDQVRVARRTALMIPRMSKADALLCFNICCTRANVAELDGRHEAAEDLRDLALILLPEFDDDDLAKMFGTDD